jgi:hypothetical protein
MFFEVELRRESYVTYIIAADSPDEAEDKAWEELIESGDFGKDASWSVESIEDVGEA